jgi:hypothetical protein
VDNGGDQQLALPFLLLTIQSVTELSKKELVTADSNGSCVVPQLLSAELKRTVLNQSLIPPGPCLVGRSK